MPKISAKHFRLTLFLAFVILILSAMPGNKIPKFDVKSGDKIGHLLAYLSLSLVFSAQYAKYLRWSNKSGQWLIAISLVCVLYGVLLEVLQGFVFYSRTFDFADMLANTVGVGLGVGAYFFGYKLLQKYQRLY